MYGMITVREKNLFPGISLRTISHAMDPPIARLSMDTVIAIMREFINGL